MRKFQILVSSLLFLVILVLILLLSGEKFGAVLLKEKPLLFDCVNDNPDLRFNTIGWLQATPYNLQAEPIVMNESTSWKGDGFARYITEPLAGRYGVVLLPYLSGPWTNVPSGRYLEQEMSIPENNPHLYVGLGIAGVLSDEAIFDFYGDCVDVGVGIFAIDEETNKTYQLFNNVLKMKRGDNWRDYKIPIPSVLRGKKVRIKVSSYPADSGCGMWNGNGEMLVVDYVCVKSG